MPKFVLLWTDVSIWLLVVALIGYAWYVRAQPQLLATWRKVFGNPAAMASSVILLLCLAVTLADSLHYRPRLPPAPGAPAGQVNYDARVLSTLDAALASLVDSREATYSRPLQYVSFTKESVTVNGAVVREAPRLVHGGSHLADPAAQWVATLWSTHRTGSPC